MCSLPSSHLDTEEVQEKELKHLAASGRRKLQFNGLLMEEKQLITNARTSVPTSVTKRVLTCCNICSDISSTCSVLTQTDGDLTSGQFLSTHIVQMDLYEGVTVCKNTEQELKCQTGPGPALRPPAGSGLR